jgi:hypothetical protein
MIEAIGAELKNQYCSLRGMLCWGKRGAKRFSPLPQHADYCNFPITPVGGTVLQLSGKGAAK